MKNAVRLLKIGGVWLIMIMGFFILALRFLEIWKKLKKLQPFSVFLRIKICKGKNIAEAVTFFILLRSRK